jgi:hypothetical protein
MFGRSVPLLAVAAVLASEREEAASIRAQEVALAQALSTRDKVALLRITAGMRHVSWDCGSVVKNFHTELSREEWIEGVSRLQIESYQARVDQIRWLRAFGADHNPVKELSIAVVSLGEHFTIHSSRGQRIERRFPVRDDWAKVDGNWKLTARWYGPQQTCGAGPY